jgi:Tol biopolymer transport system component
MESRFVKFYIAFFTIFISFIGMVQAQYFGKNKPRYRTFEFEVKETPHFKIYHYLDNPDLERDLIRDTERWYKLHQQILQDTIKFKNPILFYNNHADFQQTNAISGAIGTSTGGVTEGLKNRIVMPLTSSYAETNHVLGHEMVHAFQYNILRAGDSTSLGSIRNLPLWMVEGLAEYMSIGSISSHTAMWMRDAVLQDDVPTLEEMTSKMYEYFPYRYGHAFWAFTAGIWGDDIIKPLFKNTAMYGYSYAMDSLLNLDEDTFSKMWETALKNYYQPYLETTTTEVIGSPLVTREKSKTKTNIVPTLSPNGEYFAYYSEENIFSLDLLLADARTGEVIKTLSSTSRNNHIDAFSILESAASFSPFSDRVAFTVYAGGKNQLAIVDVANPNRQLVNELAGVPSFNNPSWSPDGNNILVSGTVEGQNDLYLFNLHSKEVKQLTNDRYAELTPSWSPDGRYIVYSTDQQTEGILSSSIRSSYRIAILDTETEEVEVFRFFPGADNLNPVFGPEGRRIYFLSDRDGFRNLYTLDLESDKLFQMTRYFTGISGITSLSPALSISRETGDIIYSYYLNNTYALYRAQPGEFMQEEVNPVAVDFRPATLPPIRAVSSRPVNMNLAVFGGQKTVEMDSVKEVPYRPDFKLDYISNSGVGVSTSRFGTGLAGGVQMLFSDILGNHQLFGGIALNGEIYDFGGQFAYVNQKHQLGWGASLSHIPYRSAGLRYLRDTISIGEEPIPVTNVQLDMLRIFEDQASVFAFYPFSTTTRMEFGASAARYSFRRDHYNNYYYLNSQLGTDREKVDAPDSYNIANVNAAYVVDNSQFGIAAPLLGSRIRLDGQRYFGELDYYSVTADYRKYFFIKPFSLAFRMMHYGRYGQDSDSERLFPIYVGNPVFIRGYDSQSVINGISPDNNYIDQLVGSRILVSNVELRIPFSGPERLALIKSRWILSDLNFFLDAGMAYKTSLPVETDEGGNLQIQSLPLFSTGISARINFFGQLIIEPYYAIPLRENGWKLGNFGLNFIPGW